MADYLEAYATRFDLPVRTGMTVDGLFQHEGRFVVTAGQHRFTADNVVVASGTWQQPKMPEFASELAPGNHLDAFQRLPQPLGSSSPAPCWSWVQATRRRHRVGLSASHPTTLSGRFHAEVPFRIEGRVARAVLPIMWFMANHVLTEKTPIGRKMQVEVRKGGGPLLRVKRADLEAAGVTYVADKTVGVLDGLPVLADGTVLDVRNVIWCTGFGKDTDWIKFPVLGPDGWPDQTNGKSTSVPGLYFVGLPFLRAFASMLIGGVGRDAETVAARSPRPPRRTAAAGVSRSRVTLPRPDRCLSSDRGPLADLGPSNAR